MNTRRRRPGERPVWGARQVDASLECICPLPGWVLLEEQFAERQAPSGLVLVEAPGTTNTVTGRVLALHEETSQELGVSPGEMVIFREWHGGKWSFCGLPTLIVEAEHILATCG